MISERNEQDPMRLLRTPANYVRNEVIVTAVAEARNDDLPHYLNVTAGTLEMVASYGDATIDGVFDRLGLSPRSISRVFVPGPVIDELAGEAELGTLASLLISAEYNDVEDAYGLSRTYKVTLEDEANIPEVCRSLRTTTAVEDAQPNYIAEVCKIPNDEFYGKQWGLHAIEAEAGWDIETGHQDVLIAIVDSGVDLQHDDLRSKLMRGEDFVDFQGGASSRYTPLGDYQTRDLDPDDEHGHGTHCAGIAAAVSNSGRGIAGVCWGGRILPIRAMFRVYDNLKGRTSSVGTSADIDAGIKFAVDKGAHVINLSLGGRSPSHGKILEYAYDRNACVLAATGNEATSDPHYPAANPRTLAVGAVDSNLNRADFSNYGSAYGRFVVAPGVKIASTYKDNGYVYNSGTSMATPFVTGLAALIVSVALRSGKQLSVDDVYGIICDTATPLGSGEGDRFYGEGLINVAAALKAARRKVR